MGSNSNYPNLGGDPTDTFPKAWTLHIGDIYCGIYQADGNGITESNEETGRCATVVLQCNWNERQQLIEGLIGSVYYDGTTIQRLDPAQYPFSTSDQSDLDPEVVYGDRMVCTSISSIRGIHWWTDPDGTDPITDPPVAGWGGYVYAIITAEFTTPIWTLQSWEDSPEYGYGGDLLGVPYCITKTKALGEVLAAPNGALIWGPDAPANISGVPLLGIGAPQIRTRMEITCTRVRMPIIPMNALLKAVGGINLTDFIVGGYHCPPGSVVFNNFNPEPRSDPQSGAIVYDIEMIFLANCPASTGQIRGVASTNMLNWNYYMSLDGNWYSVVTSQSNGPLYKNIDFSPGGASDLFTDEIS